MDVPSRPVDDAMRAFEYELEALRSENAKLRREVKRLGEQNDAACDAVWERDQKIAELQKMVLRAHGVAA